MGKIHANHATVIFMQDCRTCTIYIKIRFGLPTPKGQSLRNPEVHMQYIVYFYHNCSN